MPKVGLFGSLPEAAGQSQVGQSAGTPFADPPPSPDRKLQLLHALDEQEVRGCTKCGLSQTRTHTVFGEGDADAQIVFVGEGPGQNEDETGRPFVGRAGELLTKMITAMGTSRQEVYICNIVKCRPPGNRQPAVEEVAACSGYLQRQLEWIRPKVIVPLGLPASRYVLGGTLPMGQMRGVWHKWRGIDVMPTYHPAYVLRNNSVATRRLVWDDLKQVMSRVGLKPPANG